jgi:hypothetical protein
VVFAVFFWGLLWGIPGALIGVPIMLTVIAICAEFPSSRWVATLLSGAPPDGGKEAGGLPWRGNVSRAKRRLRPPRPPEIVDPRHGDIEDDASSTKRRSMLSLFGSLLVEISLPKLLVAWALLLVLPGLLVGLAPIVIAKWLTLGRHAWNRTLVARPCRGRGTAQGRAIR